MLFVYVFTDAAGNNPTTKSCTQKDVELAMRKYFTGARDRGADGRKRSKTATVSVDIVDNSQ